MVSETREVDGAQVIFAWDPSSGAERILLDCAQDQPGCEGGRIAHGGMISSIDGSEFGLVTLDNVFLTWNADGVPQEPIQLEYGEPGVNQLFQSFNEEWIIFRNDFADLKVFDRGGSLIQELEVAPWHLFDRMGRYALGWGFGGETSLLDASDWSVEPFTEDLGGGSIRGAGFSPSSKLVAVGIQGGPMRVFTVAEGQLIARIPVHSVTSVFWVDETHIAVGTDEGLWTVVTLDVDELITIAQAMVLRDFTPEECRTYLVESCSAGSVDG